jgi:hypothetical protein
MTRGFDLSLRPQVGDRVHHWFAGYGKIVKLKPVVKRVSPVLHVKWEKGGFGIAYTKDCQLCL